METIKLNNITFSYKQHQPLLENLSLEITPGKIHGLLGKNGEGKSTLLKLISGLIFPKQGKISTLGYEPRQRTPEMLHEICLITEELPVYPLTIDRYIRAFSPFYPRFSREHFNNLLEEFEIPSLKTKLTTMSYGQKKKLTIAFGLATGATILLMDEPTNGLDIPSKAQFRRVTASTVDKNRTLVIATHQVHDIENLLDTIIIIDRHKITLNMPLETIASRLIFKTYDTNLIDNTVIHTQTSIKGFSQIRENTTGETSRVDIEQLFNAITTNPVRIKQTLQQ
jgi:ABC-2 type transport system ATP-binding protein